MNRQQQKAMFASLVKKRMGVERRIDEVFERGNRTNLDKIERLSKQERYFKDKMDDIEINDIAIGRKNYISLKEYIMLRRKGFSSACAIEMLS